MINGRITRRQSLRYLAALGALYLSPIIGCSPTTSPATLIASRGDQRSAALLGQVWLDTLRVEPTAAELVERICGESGRAELDSDTDRMRDLITERHRSDLERGKLVSLNGWILSETEVALYALIAIVR